MGSYKKKLLLAVDGSEQSFEAVRYVSRVFPPERLELVLFHVWEASLILIGYGADR